LVFEIVAAAKAESAAESLGPEAEALRQRAGRRPQQEKAAHGKRCFDIELVQKEPLRRMEEKDESR